MRFQETTTDRAKLQVVSHPDSRQGLEDHPRKRRSDGERSRSAILHEAAQLATVDGIAGLSIGRLADAVGMSKSGLYAHFGSKQDLQLATIEAASTVFHDQVIGPASTEANGLDRLRRLLESFLRHVSGDAYPGGCFFASVLAEMDMHPGPVRDRAVEFVVHWLRQIEDGVREAQEDGALDRSEDALQLTFELEAYLLLANTQYVVTHDAEPIDRARTAIARRLVAASATA